MTASPDERPFLSIVTVSLNNAPGLRETLESVERQTFRDFELIVVDGGSTDGTLDLLREKCDLVSVSVSEPDRGIYDAMNKGLSRARGDLVYFLNAGDRFHSPDALASIRDAFDECGRPDILYGDVYVHPLDGPSYLQRHPALTRPYLSKQSICHQALFVSMRAVEQVGQFDLAFPVFADHQWLLRALFEKKLSNAHAEVAVADFRLGGFSSEKGSQREILGAVRSVSVPMFLLVFVQLKAAVLQVRIGRLLDRLRRGH